jgi:uridine kinase
MHRHFDRSETPKDKTYQNVMRRLNSFMERLSTEADKQLLSNMISDCYYKNNEAINEKEKDDPSLLMPLVMSLVLDQQLMIDKLKNLEKQ